MDPFTAPSDGRPTAKLPPWDPKAVLPESEAPGVWDWTPPDNPAWPAAVGDMTAKAPKPGPDGASDNDNLLNIVLAILTGLAVVAVTKAVVRSITR